MLGDIVNQFDSLGLIAQLGLAMLAGLLTIIAPCILPVIPVVVGVSVGQSRWRPVAVVAGLIASFTLFGTIFTLFSGFLGLTAETWRVVAVVVLILFGLVLLWPRPYQLLSERLVGWFTARRRAPVADGDGRGLGSGFLVGVSLGLIWTPCAGPVLGAILTLAASGQNVVLAGLLMLAYALGAGIPMLLIGYGSTWVVRRLRWLSQHNDAIQRVAGVLLILTAIGIYFGLDRAVQACFLPFYYNFINL